MAMHCCELARYSKLFKIQAVWPLIWEFCVISSVCSSFFVWRLFPWHPLTKKLTWLPSLQQFRNFLGYFNPPRTQSNEAPRIVAKDRGHCKVVSQFPISLQVCGFLLSPLLYTRWHANVPWISEIFSLTNERKAKRRNAREPLAAHVFERADSIRSRYSESDFDSETFKTASHSPHARSWARKPLGSTVIQMETS